MYMIIPTRMYTLLNSASNAKKPSNFGFVKDGKSYVLAFPSLEHANLVKRNVSSLSRMDLQVREKNDDVDIVRTSITKRISINESMPLVQETSITDIIHYPFTKNVGVIFNIELQHEDRELIIFDGIAIDPTNNIEIFKSHLDV